MLRFIAGFSACIKEAKAQTRLALLQNTKFTALQTIKMTLQRYFMEFWNDFDASQDINLADFGYN